MWRDLRRAWILWSIGRDIARARRRLGVSHAPPLTLARALVAMAARRP